MASSSAASFTLPLHALMLTSSPHRSMTGSLSVFATSSFQQHSSGLAALGVASSIIGSTSLPFIAKFSDVFGRPSIYLLCMVLQVVGYIISMKSPTLAACTYPLSSSRRGHS